MIDPDDAEVIRLDWALRDLRTQCDRLVDPEQGWWAWLELVIAVLLHGQSPGRPLSWTLLTCARRITAEIKASL